MATTRIRGPGPPVAAEIELQRAWSVIETTERGLIDTELLPAYRNASGSRDSLPRGLSGTLSQMQQQLKSAVPRSRLQKASVQASKVVDAANKSAHDRQLSSALGLPASINPKGKDGATKAWRKGATDIIVNVRDDAIPALRDLVDDSWRKGHTAEQLDERLAKLPLSFGTVGGRTQVIARDQVEKLNGQMSELNQNAMGAKTYLWRTSADSRVRKSHRRREGKRYAWSRPPPDGNPGQPVNCRCRPEAVVNLDKAVKSPDVTTPESAAARVASPESRQRRRQRAARVARAQTVSPVTVATEALRAENSGFVEDRKRLLDASARRLGSEAEFQDLARRQSASRQGQSSVRPGGLLVTDVTDSKVQRDAWVASLTEDERQAVHDWSTEQHFRQMRMVDSGRDASASTQRVLTGPTDQSRDKEATRTLEAERRLALFREAIAKAPRFEGTAWRGIRDLPGDSALRKALDTPGATIELEAVSSWSSDVFEARGFAADGEGSYLLQVVTKRGAIISDSRTVVVAGEGEVMIDKGAKFKVTTSRLREGDESRKLVVLEEI